MPKAIVHVTDNTKYNAKIIIAAALLIGFGAFAGQVLPWYVERVERDNAAREQRLAAEEAAQERERAAEEATARRQALDELRQQGLALYGALASRKATEYKQNIEPRLLNAAEAYWRSVLDLREVGRDRIEQVNADLARLKQEQQDISDRVSSLLNKARPADSSLQEIEQSRNNLRQVELLNRRRNELSQKQSALEADQSYARLVFFNSVLRNNTSDGYFFDEISPSTRLGLQKDFKFVDWIADRYLARMKDQGASEAEAMQLLVEARKVWRKGPVIHLDAGEIDLLKYSLSEYELPVQAAHPVIYPLCGAPQFKSVLNGINWCKSTLGYPFRANRENPVR